MKLILSDRTLLFNPTNIKKFSGKLHEISFPDLYQYSIETPIEFIKEKLKAISLETYNFYMSGQAEVVVALLQEDSSAT